MISIHRLAAFKAPLSAVDEAVVMASIVAACDEAVSSCRDNPDVIALEAGKLTSRCRVLVRHHLIH